MGLTFPDPKRIIESQVVIQSANNVYKPFDKVPQDMGSACS